ncbi:protein PAM68, chloroplastic [Euphorbia lathyris]|uniref:protein PAM68, chloroplastic n=1 Tax=Euphorbia lathyris TaxID=212925 RepID=UPI00331327C3
MAAIDVVVIRPLLSTSSAYPKNGGHFLQASTFQFPVSNQNSCRNPYPFSYTRPVYATVNSPKGFGPPPKKSKKKKKSKTPYNEDDNDDNDDDNNDYDEPDAGVIPEVVTNRMMSRMGFSVGVPLFIGLLFFPFFYYLKVGLKIDVPTWVPFIVSFFFFGTALLGVSYGIVSSSWDPMRKGSLLGWNEAQKNWPVFWQSLWGKSGKD